MKAIVSIRELGVAPCSHLLDSAFCRDFHRHRFSTRCGLATRQLFDEAANMPLRED